MPKSFARRPSELLHEPSGLPTLVLGLIGRLSKSIRPERRRNRWLVREKGVENFLAQNDEVRSHLLASRWWFPTAQVRIR